MQHQMYNNTQ